MSLRNDPGKRPDGEGAVPPRRRRTGPSGAGLHPAAPHAPSQPSRDAPAGVMWPTDGFDANQYSPAGEVAAVGRLMQAIQRRLRRGR